MNFEARIAGEGPLLGELNAEILRRGLGDQVKLLGQLHQSEVGKQFEWADVLLHTGVVAKSGDRDGLPNVIPESMAAGVLVVTSPVSATTEAIAHELTGLVADVDFPLAWLNALRRLSEDDALATRLRAGAREWVEQNYDAHKNTARLVECFEAAVKRSSP